MCGIAGVFHPHRSEPAVLRHVRAMTSALAHRGPDDHQLRALGGVDPYAALGVQRLAIIDPAGNLQPVSDPQSGRFHVVQNGEIYNYKRIRGELTGFEVDMRSDGDTEVIAALIARQGVDGAIPRLVGQFAIAAVDVAERRLSLVRDRMGQKPLYYSLLPDGGIAFASEIKGLLQHPEVRRELDPVALRQYLLWEYVPTPRSIYAGIRKLEPGTCLQIDPSGLRTWRYWTPPVPRGPGEGSLKKWAQSLHGALQVATLHRMRADVPVGYLLSGGIDSTTVSTLAASRTEGPLRTFSVAVDAPGFDESEDARAVSAHLGTHHTEVHFGPDDLPVILDQITSSLCEPLADSSLLPTWKLMAAVQESGLRCVLSGDGADESFAGYPTYMAHLLARAATPVRGLLGRAASRMPTTHEGVSRDYMARRFAQGLGLDWHRRHQLWMGAWLPEELGIRADGPEFEEVDAHAQVAQSETDPVARAMYLDQRLYLSDGVLVKVDRASMAHGVEVRSPFLDHTVVELAADIPTQMKLKPRQSKIVLKRAMADEILPSALTRKKKGFGAPVGPWLRGPATAMVDELPERLAEWIPSATLRRTIEEHRQGRADHRRRLWSALVLSRWLDGPWGPGA